ncbi:MAG: TolC family protein [Muribaculaceae bacterium]|nr:TolC family protein [Muribaculaceae bacterium]MDE5958540.1 TolC family protein [Muribaculaceae bacterium]MDE5971342.1 TolC family protein [Muribaculaceae bacterium]MDE6508808.1 TolC family protein [Muribaculaceae bacterium]
MNRLLAIAVAAAASVPAAMAQSADFNRIISTVLSNNPQLAADSLTARAGLLEMAAEGNLPETEAGFDHLWSARDNEPRWGVEVSQSFDWPGVYAARRKALGAARSAEEAAARARVRQTALQARLLLIDVVDANLQIKARKQIAENLDSMLALTRQRFDNGDVTILTLKKMEMARYSAIADLDQAENDLDRLRADLAAMAGGTLIDTDGLTEFPESTLLAEADYVGQDDPATLALTLESETERLKERTEALRRWPGFSVGYLHEFEEGQHFNGFSVGLSLPLFSTRNQKAAATARSLAADAAATNARLTRAAAIRSTYAEASRLSRRIEAYHSVFGNDNYPELLHKAYDRGQLTAHEYLGEINEYMTMYLDHLAAETAFHRAVATLRAL